MRIVAAAAAWRGLTALDIGSSRLGTKAWSELVTAEWPRLQDLNVADFMWDVHSRQSLAASNWSCLASLDLSGSFSIHKTFHHLANASFRHLTRLVLGGQDASCVDLSVLPHTSFWPNLKHLTVQSHDSPYSFQVARQGHYSLDEVHTLVASPGQALHTLIVPCQADGIIEATPSKDVWPCDTQLDLKVPFEVTIMQTLAVGVWPIKSLQVLDCGDDYVASSGNLVQCSLTDMSAFVFRSERGDMTAEGLHIILQSISESLGDWPALRKFRVSSTNLNDTHMSRLAASSWPLVESISFTVGLLGLEGVTQLKDGMWPSSRIMTVTQESMSRTLSNLQQLFAWRPFVEIRCGCCAY